MTSELAIRTAIKRELERRGAFVVVTTGVGLVGCPDLIVCLDGRFYAFEVKKPGGRVEPIQTYRLTGVIHAGGVAAVVRSVQDALGWLEEKGAPDYPVSGARTSATGAGNQLRRGGHLPAGALVEPSATSSGAQSGRR